MSVLQFKGKTAKKKGRKSFLNQAFLEPIMKITFAGIPMLRFFLLRYPNRNKICWCPNVSLTKMVTLPVEMIIP
jgi:hypothetical protein